MNPIDRLQILAAALLGVVALFAASELIGLLDTLLTGIVMRRFAREHGWKYTPGRSSLFFQKPFELVEPGEQELTILAYRRPPMRYHRSRLHLTMNVHNPRRGSLHLRPDDTLFAKRRYFKDGWDRKLKVQSKPVAFGRTIFASRDFLKETYAVLRHIGVHPRNRLAVLPSGQLEIMLVDKAFTRQRADALIRVAKEIARQVEGMGIENIPSD